MSNIMQNLVAVLGIIIIGVIGYYLYSQNGSNLLVGTRVSTSSQASIEASEFLNRLNQLKTINLDDSLFNDPRFQTLESVRTRVEPVPVGRNNPFSVRN